MRKLCFAFVLVILLVSCTTTEYVYVPQKLDISESTGILFDSRPVVEITERDVSTYEGLLLFTAETVDAYGQYHDYSIRLESYLTELQRRLMEV